MGAVKGRYVIESFARAVRGRNISMEMKRGLKNNILMPTLKFGSDLNME